MSYARIPNEFTDTLLQQDLSGLQIRIVLLVVRHTVGAFNQGFNPREAALSVRGIMDRLKTPSERSVRRAIKSLVEDGYLTAQMGVGHQSSVYSVNGITWANDGTPLFDSGQAFWSGLNGPLREDQSDHSERTKVATQRGPK